MAKVKPTWWPKKMTENEFNELDNQSGGICLACGELKYGDCEPDARNYPCDDCEKRQVYGAEEARIMGAIEVTQDASWYATNS